MSESTLESAQYQLKKRTQEKIADLARKYDVRTEEHVPVQTVSNWIEAIGPGDLVSTADRYTWTIPKSKFQSKSPSQNDTIYFL
ncbi:hypothetical protein EXW96_26740 [Paenibacillus sp. JMULE4]|uniref:hypothetical protein n=1 Tax=Paenibacillus sp. JMULE4 TaxID=2518342 RepID=UPI001575738B|nr:hypothetical protein [Paenibacillus sp. JMULE4]NTZ20987.1 hypothetical protein [Paenibacillus sp. JMULE4]